MLAKVKSGALKGVDVYIVEGEIFLSFGLPAFTTVGLPDAAVKESKDRVRAAVKSSGYRFPPNRVTLNLAPADARKEGTGFDLPVAVGVLIAQDIMPQEPLDKYLLLGDLSLDGRLKPTRGILSIALAAREAGREARVLGVGRQAPDHPWIPAMPETAYLKAFLLQLA